MKLRCQEEKDSYMQCSYFEKTKWKNSDKSKKCPALVIAWEEQN
jgi:hypothetical protein